MNKTLTIDTTNMCSHLQKKLFEEEGSSQSLAEMPLHISTSPTPRIFVSHFTSIRIPLYVYMSPRVPLLEFDSSTTGIREFHCWNSGNGAFFDDYSSSSYEL